MILPTDDPTETLKRKATIFILVLMSLATMIATAL
jgi:hypothetical protein